MVNRQLIDYIKRQLAQGYNVNSIKLNLARSGYTPEQIEPAVIAATGKPTKNLLKMLLLMGGGAVIAAALITALILFLGGTDEIKPVSELPNEEVGLSIGLAKNVLKPGENLIFNVRLVNLGSGSNFGVALTNEINKAGRLIKSEDDTFNLGLQENRDYEMELDVEDVDEGEYLLKTTVEFGGEMRTESVYFRVSEEEMKEEVIVKKLEVLSGSIVETIEDIKLVAETEPTRAKTLCLSLESVLEKDTCLLQTGLKVNDQNFCTGINDNDKKDSCYVNIALALKNYNLCNQITDQNLRDACLALGG